MVERRGVLIIGAGHGGSTVAAQLRQLHYDGAITLISDEPHYPYHRPPLSKEGESGDTIQLLFPEHFHHDNNIELMLDTRVESVDTTGKSVRTAAGAVYHYDALVFATGAAPRELPIAGASLRGVQTLRTFDDRCTMREAMARGCRFAIVGAGFVGLEVAALAQDSGCPTTVVEAAGQVLARVASPGLAAHLTQIHRDNGVTIVCSRQVVEFEGRNGQLTGVRLSDGTSVPCEHAVVGVGARPRDELGQAAGLACWDGVQVDADCRTSVDGVFAVGDCTRREHDLFAEPLRLESIPSALEQARVVAHAVVGTPRHAHAVPWFWSDQMATKVKNVGVYTPALETIVVDPATCREGERGFFHLDESGVVAAIETVNSPRLFAMGKQMVARGGRVERESIEHALSGKTVQH